VILNPGSFSLTFFNNALDCLDVDSDDISSVTHLQRPLLGGILNSFANFTIVKSENSIGHIRELKALRVFVFLQINNEIGNFEKILLTFCDVSINLLLGLEQQT
jgi:hypothetical protein